jgi:hypothetical protein
MLKLSESLIEEMLLLAYSSPELLSNYSEKELAKL